MTRTAGRVALALAGGLLLTAGHAPFDVGLLVGPVALVPVLALARSLSSSRHPLRAAALWGWLVGLVPQLVLLMWLRRFGELPWLALSVVQALAVAAFLVVVVAWDDRRGRGLVAVAAWVALEGLRSAQPLSGFPWLLLGLTQHGGGPYLVIARVLGEPGVSAALVATSVGIEGLLVALRSSGRGRRLGPPTAVLGGVALVALACALVPVPSPDAAVAPLDVAAVQGYDLELPPVIARQDSARIEGVAQRQLEATRALADDPPTLTVWPENALDGDVASSPALQAILVEALELLDGGPLLTGEIRDGAAPDTFENDLVLYGPDAVTLGVHVKRVLVPFGEYVPLRPLLGDIGLLRLIAADGVPGREATVLDVDGRAVAPILCFESIYPALVRDQVRAGAQALIVSTNTSSFGRTAASAQHLAASQLRAVETGRWVLHAGISGISAVVAPDGSTTQETELFSRAIVRTELPMISGSTPFVAVGDVVTPLAGALSAGAVLLRVLRGRRMRSGAPEGAGD